MVSRNDLDERLRALIAGMDPGDVLPSATEMKQRWGAAFSQIRVAVDQLVDEGLLRRRARKVWVAHAPGPRARSSTAAEIEQRAKIIIEVRRVGLTVSALERQGAAELVILAGTGVPELAHERVRLAALTLHSPNAEAIRSALGLDERTRGPAVGRCSASSARSPWPGDTNAKAHMNLPGTSSPSWTLRAEALWTFAGASSRHTRCSVRCSSD